MGCFGGFSWVFWGFKLGILGCFWVFKGASFLLEKLGFLCKVLCSQFFVFFMLGVFIWVFCGESFCPHSPPLPILSPITNSWSDWRMS